MIRTLLAMILAASAANAGDDPRIDLAFRSAGVSAAELAQASRGMLANRDKSAVVIAVHRPKRSLVVMLLRQSDGGYRAVDISGVEGGNFGKLGFPRSHYDRFETQPVEWLAREDGLFQVVMRTQAWRSGQRYTTSEPLIVRPDGTPIWR